jgi:AcrR family transcriptional regulator
MKTKKDSYLNRGRAEQKRRTRQRVLDAAAELIAEGKSPTVTDAADLAKVSRRTAYRYFSTQQQMLAEAALTMARSEITEIKLPEQVDQRVDHTVRALQGFVYENEAALRLLVQMNMQVPIVARAGKRSPIPPRVNRVKFIERALLGIHKRLKAAEYERLVSALVLCMGIESAMALGYIRQLSPAQATEVCAWAAQQLLRGALEG